MGQSSSSPSRGKANAEEPTDLVEPRVDITSSRVVQFMWKHQEHCADRYAHTTPPLAAKIFTLFPLLPPELRYKIWEAVAAHHHIVE